MNCFLFHTAASEKMQRSRNSFNKYTKLMLLKRRKKYDELFKFQSKREKYMYMYMYIQRNV